MHALWASQPICEEKIVNKKLFLFYPPNTFKDIYWDLMQSVCLLVTCILTPFNLAFTDELAEIKWYIWFNYTIDIIFFVDVVFNFNSAFTDEE